MKHINKFKFCKETINSIEIKTQSSLVGLCDDSGEIKLCDLRESGQSAEQTSITLKKKLTGHTNICSTIKFDPSSEHYLYSGSFDCSLSKRMHTYLIVLYFI